LAAGLAELSFAAGLRAVPTSARFHFPVAAGLGAMLTSARFLRPFVAGLGVVPTSERFHFPFAAVVHEGRLARFAGSMVVGWNAGSLAA
jgi:hypothetical protein